MRIAQITDLHVHCFPTTNDAALPTEDRLRSEHAAAFEQAKLKSLTATLAELKHESIDLVAMTGDLAGRPPRGVDSVLMRTEAYRRLRAILDASGLRYCVLPGNHDRVELLRATFPEPPLDEVIGGWRVIAFWDRVGGDRTTERTPEGMALFTAALADPTPQVHLQHCVIEPWRPGPPSRKFLRQRAELAAALNVAHHRTVVVAGHLHHGRRTTTIGSATYVVTASFGKFPMVYRVITLDKGGVSCEERLRAAPIAR